MTVYPIENQYWKILKQLPKKNSTFLNAHLMEGITGCNVIQDIVGAFIRTQGNQFLERLQKLESQTVLQFLFLSDH